MSNQKIYTSIQQWMADKGIENPEKDLKMHLFSLWRDKEVEVAYWKNLYERLNKSHEKLRSDFKTISKRTERMLKTAKNQVIESYKTEALSEDWRVYIISERKEDKRHFKIGYSKDPLKRVKQLQTGHPEKLGLEGWYSFPTETDARRFEAWMHNHYSKFQTKGEWFSWNNLIESQIKMDHKTNQLFTRYIS